MVEVHIFSFARCITLVRVYNDLLTAKEQAALLAVSGLWMTDTEFLPPSQISSIEVKPVVT